MGSPHVEDEQDPSSLFDTKFSALSQQIDTMSKELEKMAELYNITSWEGVRENNSLSKNGFENGCSMSSTPCKQIASYRSHVPDLSVLNESSASLLNSEENSNMSFIGDNSNMSFLGGENSNMSFVRNFPSSLFDGDSNCSFNLNDSLIDKMNKKDVKKQRLVIKFKRITKKYFMVNKLPIKDHKLKKFFLDYEADRYYFQVYVNDLPKTYQCKQCPKVFNKITSLQFHKRTHSKLPQGKFNN